MSESSGVTKPYKTIPLTRGQIALVDVEDYEWLSQWKWYADRYAKRQQWDPSLKRQRPVKMHREIMGLKMGDRRDVDHVNGNSLDNRRSNLRICNRSQNVCNKGKLATNRTGFKGVSEREGRYYAQISINGKKKWLGQRGTPEEAYALYLEAAKELHGEFAHV